MTISTKIIGYYHQSTCPSNLNKENSSNDCNKSIQVTYQCSNPICNVLQQSTNVQGCQKAREIVTKTFPCKCASY